MRGDLHFLHRYHDFSTTISIFYTVFDHLNANVKFNAFFSRRLLFCGVKLISLNDRIMKLSNLLALSSLLLGVLAVGCQKNTPDVDVVHLPPVVKTGEAQTIHLPADSVLLTGSATDSGSRIVSWLWSEVSGPNVPVIASEGSQSTKVYGLIMGQYIFQLTATDTFGLTGVNMVQVTVTGPDSVVVVANGTNSHSIEYIGNSTQDFTNAGNLEMGAETWTISSSQVAVRSVFRFDSLPAGPVKSAKLSLYSDPNPGTANLTTPNFGTANAFYIQRVSSSWTTAANGTWATQPSVDAAGGILIPTTSASSLDLQNIDVTALVNKMIAAGNYGFEIRLQTEAIYNSRIFCAGAYSDATKHPKLVLGY